MPVYESDVCEEYRPEVKPEVPFEVNGGNLFLAWGVVVGNQTQYLLLPVSFNRELISLFASRGVRRVVQLGNVRIQGRRVAHFERNREVD
jgi:hypothetical protein